VSLVKPSTALLIVVIAAAFGAGSLVKRLRPVPAPVLSADLPLPLGSTLARTVVVQNANGYGTGLYTLVDSVTPTVMFVFSVACQSCLGEAERFKEVAHVAGGRRHYVAIVCAQSFDAFKSVVGTLQFPFTSVLCDPGARQGLHLKVSPTVYEVSPALEITFNARGPAAIEALEKKLGVTTSRQAVR